MGYKTTQGHLLNLLKSITATSAGYAEAINSYGRFLNRVDEEIVKLQDLEFGTSLMSCSIDELNRITHQINRCLKVCERGDLEEMEQLRDELLSKKDNFH